MARSASTSDRGFPYCGFGAWSAPELARAGVRKSDVRLVAFRTDEEREGQTRKSALRSEMQEEVSEGWAGPVRRIHTFFASQRSTWRSHRRRGRRCARRTIGGHRLGTFAEGPMSDAARFLFVFILR